MSERKVVLDEPTMIDESGEAVRQATERAERAERELAKLKQNKGVGQESMAAEPGKEGASANGRDELNKDLMMAHLITALEAGEDIGHYGRLTFCMVARHFLSREEMIDLLGHDRDFTTEAAEALLNQVESHAYNPPRKEKIQQWQKEQKFPIIPSDDPDCGNVYRTLTFPDGVYEHIEGYQSEKAHSN